MPARPKITPCLWFERQAEEAAHFYTSIFPGSSINRILRATADTPGPKTGDVLLVEFTLAGQRYQALNGGPHEKFNDAISLSVDCAGQNDVDHYWEALTRDGGRPVQCGWLKDKYGLSWQIVPRRLTELTSDPDPDKARRALEAVLKMVKIDIAVIEQAANGR